MRKRLLALITGVSLLVGLASCGKETVQPVEPTKETEAAPTEAASADGTPTDAAPTAIEPTETAPTEATPTETPAAPTPEQEKEDETKVTDGALFRDIERTSCYKGLKYNNPLITQAFGADPYAMVYGDTLYVYMTADVFEKNSAGIIGENTYGKIKGIRVISTKDMVNWTDHGEIHIAGVNGSAKWAHNSWAPAAAWKNIDGKDQFFLYFADGGGGIGVLQSDSPTGPFKDPIGKGLITRSTPNCADVLWLFDPAVLVDDDGRAYIYFGGGVPQGKEAHPMTGRVAELGDDMISIKGEPQLIDAPYLFEDSGIHKYGNKYYYTYCTNWSVDADGKATYGFNNAEIACMVSDSPMGPFEFKETILDNPGKAFGLYGNNHHCVFEFKGDWYITYHTRVLEQAMKVEKGYRCTFINKFTMQEDGTIGKIKQTRDGCEALDNLNPYQTVNACTFSHQAGLEVTGSEPISNYFGSGDMALTSIDTGDFFKVSNVDFSYREPDSITMNIRKSAELTEDCVIELRLDSFQGDVIGYVHVAELLDSVGIADEFTEVTAELKKKPDGVHNLYMTFSGSGYEILNWRFNGAEVNWYDDMIETSLISTGDNGRLEKVMAKLANGETVNVAFIGGSVTEGAGAAKITESYADQVIARLEKLYPQANINYVNAGLGGTPSSLGIMRYHRDVTDKLGIEPDLLFIEFSVNDYQEATNGRAFESLIRAALNENENTAVCLVFAVFKSKWNMQDNYIPMGKLYGLPMVSIKDGTKLPFEKKQLTDAKFFSDEYHPTSYGHGIMADCIVYMLSEAAKKEIPEKVSAVPENNVTSNAFEGSLLVTAADANGCEINAGSFSAKDTSVHGFMRTGQSAFPDNWMHAKDSGNDEFSIKLTCKNMLINYKQSSSSEAGAIAVYVDGEFAKEINCYNAGGWNQSIVELVLDEDVAAEHTITFRMKEGDEEKTFTILALSYTK